MMTVILSASLYTEFNVMLSEIQYHNSQFLPKISASLLNTDST